MTQVFFSTDWLDAFVTSLRNFFTLIFRSVALPKLLAFQLTRLEEPALKMRLRTSQSECNRLRCVCSRLLLSLLLVAKSLTTARVSVHC